MFGSKLKSWMEAHLGRQRHKSSANSSSISITSSSSNGPTTAGQSNLLIAVTTKHSACGGSCTPSFNQRLISHTPSSQPEVGGVTGGGKGEKTVCSPAGRLWTPDPSATSNVQVQPHERKAPGGQIPGSCSMQAPGNSPAEKESPHINSSSICNSSRGGDQGQESRAGLNARTISSPSQSSLSVPGGHSSSSSSSASGLLFCHNLSSPDTGYSTDGYSPKSGFPVLSFESSGKSTPKSSYTISSLVSSERLHSQTSFSTTASTGSKSIGPSKNSSISNGLELDEEELEQGPVGVDNEIGISDGGKDGGGSGGGRIENSNLSPGITCSYNQPRPSVGQGVGGGDNHNFSKSDGNGPLENNEQAHKILSPPSQPSSLVRVMSHKRAESLGDPPGASAAGSEPNRDSVVGAGTCGTELPRSVRTSLLLSSHIPPDCSPGLKNAFSICSPRRQRTRIKTNPWVSLTQHNDNIHANYLRSKMELEKNTNNNHYPPELSFPSALTEELSPEPQLPPPEPAPASHHRKESQDTGGGAPLCKNYNSTFTSPQDGSPHGSQGQCQAEVKPEVGDCPLSSESIDLIMSSSSGSLPPPPAESSLESQVRYRIVASFSASDSGKGTLEPSTNRNSTESSQLFSDSTSTPGSVRTSSSIISNSNTANTSPVQTPPVSCVVLSSSSTYSDPSPVLTSSSVELLNNSVGKAVGGAESGSGTAALPGPPSLEKETDILSDWPNTDDEEAPILADQDGDRTPTPSSPDHHHTFNNSSSSSGKIDFLRAGRLPGVSNCKSGFSSSVQFPPSNMNLPTTACYPPPNINFHHSASLTIPDPYALDNLNHHLLDGGAPKGCSVSHLPFPPGENSGESEIGSKTSLARGAIGFLRKMFRKGASSRAASTLASFNSAGGKSRLFRSSSSSRGSHSDTDNNIDSNTIIPVSLLSPETVVVTNYPLANTKPLSPAINSSFLTPTPNAFRRRHANPASGSTLGSADLSDGNKSSKHPARTQIKTDIIRLPQPVLPPAPSSVLDADCEALTSPRIPYHPMMYKGNSSNSTTGSSLNSLSIMSTSTTASKGSFQASEHEEDLPEDEATPVLAHRQYQQYSSPVAPPRHSRNQSGNSQVIQHPSSVNNNHRAGKGGHGHASHLENAPQPSPRLPTRIASPSFNNYSPMHRMVVTGANFRHPAVTSASSNFNPSSTSYQVQSTATYSSPPSVPPPPPPAHAGVSPASLSTFQPSPSPRTSSRSPYLNHVSSSPSVPPRTGTNFRHQSSLSSFHPGTSHTLNAYPVSNQHLVNVPHQNTNYSPSLSSKYHTRESPSPQVHQMTYSPNPYHANYPNLQQQHPQFSSPSPVLRNPRYQYVASSNQNSPLLNVQKRMNGSEFDPGMEFPQPQAYIQGFSGSHNRKNSPSVRRSHSELHPPRSYYASPIQHQHQHRSNRRKSSASQDRIYESVDISESETSRSDEGDGDGGEFELRMQKSQQQSVQLNYHNPRPHPRGSVPTRQLFQPGQLYNREARENAFSRKCDRAKRNLALPLNPDYLYSQSGNQNCPPVPPRSTPLSMGTFLSETETRLLEVDNATDLRYKRLIREAENLLKEISIQKSNQPWLSHYRPEQLGHEECPQSDPLRRKAYDCWAIRRLQQELAGCCASPPVLHRSRLHITSPMTPNGNRSFVPPGPSDIPSHSSHVPQNRRSSLNLNESNGHMY